MQWEKAAFSQYLRNQLSPGCTMGYIICTKTHCYMGWFPYNRVHFVANTSNVIVRTVGVILVGEACSELP